MIGRANRPLLDRASKCYFMCHSARKEFYKKFLFEALPVESHLDIFLADHLNTEIFSTTVKDNQDAIDFLTWTLLYRRLTENPNYYNLQGVSHRHISDHLSELVETTFSQLEEAGCVLTQEEEDADEGGVSVELLNPGLISAHYFIKYDTIELFTSSLSESTKLKGLIDILSNAKEFSDIPVRHKEPGILNRLAGHLPVKIESPRFNEPSVKVNILLQAHFSRVVLKPDLRLDQKEVLKQILKLIYGMVDVLTTFGGLKSALCAMELAQMIVQGVWVTDSPLKQLPFFTDEVIERCVGANVNRIEHITDLEDDQRDELLRLTPKQMMKVAEACNRFPDLEVEFQILTEDIVAGEPVSVRVILQREIDEDEELGFVFAPHYPGSQLEQWWIIVGDSKADHLVAVKRTTVQRQAGATITFNAPANLGDFQYTLMIVCDSYVGCDQEYDLPFTVTKLPDHEDAEDDKMED